MAGETKTTAPKKSVNELVQDILVDTREQINTLLEGTNDILRVNFTTKFDQMINQIGFINGHGASISSPKRKVLQPLTEFMGEPMVKKISKKVTTTMLSPEDERKQQFKKDVEDLAVAFHTLTNEQILESYKNNSIVIRGVAKNAGLEKFRPEEVQITTSFLDDIRTALGATADFNQNKIKIGEDLENLDQQ